MRNFIRSLFMMVIFLGVGFAGGMASNPPAPQESQEVAYETAPGPYGSGVLGEWGGLSHGLYCFQPTGAVTAYTRATKAGNPVSSAAMACQGEDVRLYGDSITFGGKSAFAAEMKKLGLTLFVDAWSGRPTTPIGDAVVKETSFPADVIFATGTNDIFNPTVMAAQIKRIVAHIKAVSPNTRVWWVDVQATRWGQTDAIERNDQRNSMAVNLAIYQNMPVNRILQWSQRFMCSPSLLTTYLKDGVHPKDAASYGYWAAILRGWFVALGGGK